MAATNTSVSSKLKYTSDSMPGIKRESAGKTFKYFYRGKKVINKNILERIRKLVIPPAWTDVWICPKDNGHLQATGFDKMGRKQYKYHSYWSKKRNDTKFHHLFDFGKALPALRKRLQRDINKPVLSKEKVLAAVISLMEQTYMRIGNCEYEKLYGSYGLTTLKDNHVKIRGSDIRFSFNGKKGIHQAITLTNRRLAKIIKSCRDIPGKELFQYINKNGSHEAIDSGMVNDYLKEVSNIDFTAKDFRTWAGSLVMLSALKSQKNALTHNEVKHNIVKALDDVSLKLGNTRAVCKKYYVHPEIISLYEKGDLEVYLKELQHEHTNRIHYHLTNNEKVLMKILRKFDTCRSVMQ
ncbi:MAG TPA: DNA topoisomerase IB [Cyclobacteriaceae bacterium]